MNGLQNVLDQLGEDEQSIAKTLDWAGVKGRRGSTSECPVANFVRLYYPDAYEVVVTPQQVCLWEEEDSMPRVTETLLTPEVISAFVASFDQGRYPTLDHREERRHELEEQVETKSFLGAGAAHTAQGFPVRI